MLVAVTVSTGGCGGDDKSGGVQQPGEGVTVEQRGDSVTITSKQGTAEYTAGASATIPKDLPEDVPTYPGMQVQFAGKESQMFTIQGQTDDALATVSDSLKGEAVKRGWSEVMSMNQSAAGGQPGLMISYTKDNRVLNLVLASEGEGTVISIVTGQQ
jgi:hypothetical protein